MLLFQAQQLELHFTLGEALVMVALGSHSPDARNKWLTPPEQYKVQESLQDTAFNTHCHKVLQSLHKSSQNAAVVA